jgi:AbrB family looped-hinge helix DNA binding protein
MMKVKIDDYGRIVIPEGMRKSLGLKDSVYVVLVDNQVVITKEYDPIREIDNILARLDEEYPLEYADILYEAKNKMKEVQ